MRVLNLFLATLAAVVLTGCAGYHLGPVNGAVAGEKSVEILPFNNQTLQPRLGDAVTQALRERLQVDGTYHLASSGAADLVVSGVIGRYDREQLGYLNNDSATPQNFRVSVTAHVIIRERASGKLFLERDVKAHTLVNVGADFASSERQSAPLLAADLAQNIVELLTEGSW
jgi:hypothetical protein